MTHRQPFSTVASSSAIQAPVSERSRVGMKSSSWCHACPGLPLAFMNSIDCMHFTFGPMTAVRTSTMAGADA
jgi:hypothetical protein